MTWAPLALASYEPPNQGYTCIGLLCVVLAVAGFWKMFVKAGRPGWAALIPIYNVVVALEVAGKPGWWVVLYLVPVVNLVIALIASLALARRFGQDALYGVGLWLLPFIFAPILGFGSATYRPSAP